MLNPRMASRYRRAAGRSRAWDIAGKEVAHLLLTSYWQRDLDNKDSRVAGEQQSGLTDVRTSTVAQRRAG